MEPVVSAALSEAVKAVVDKLREGKKLSVEDVFLLYLGTVTDELRAVRAEMGEMSKRIDETNKRIDETNKRIDDLYKLLSNIYQVLLDIFRQLSAK